jgi:hypothetical protein
VIGCSHVAAPPIANVSADAPEGPHFAPLVVDDFAGCTPHRVIVSLDARPTSSVTITCPPPLPPPLPGQRVVVVTDSMPRTFDGAAFAIAPGRHTIAVRDELTGRSAELVAWFPDAHADTIVILDDDREITISINQRSLLIFM